MALLDHSRGRGEPLYALWFLIATTGLRRAQALALRWDDVDRARLTIRPTVTVAGGIAVWQHNAKSDDSERTIALDTRTVAVLHDHRRQHLEQRLAAGPVWSTHDQDRELVFTRPDGTAIPPKRASQMFTRHADPAVTMQVYAHALEGDDATAAAIFGGCQHPPPPDTTPANAVSRPAWCQNGVNTIQNAPDTSRGRSVDLPYPAS